MGYKKLKKLLWIYLSLPSSLQVQLSKFEYHFRALILNFASKSTQNR